jgi:hypothetical protein
MTPRALYHRLIVQGFDLALTLDGRLAVEPASKLSDELRAAIRKHKTALMGILQLEDERLKSKKGRGLVARRPAG